MASSLEELEPSSEVVVVLVETLEPFSEAFAVESEPFYKAFVEEPETSSEEFAVEFETSSEVFAVELEASSEVFVEASCETVAVLEVVVPAYQESVVVLALDNDTGFQSLA